MKVTLQQLDAPAVFVPFTVTLNIETPMDAAVLEIITRLNVTIPAAVAVEVGRNRPASHHTQQASFHMLRWVREALLPRWGSKDTAAALKGA